MTFGNLSLYGFPAWSALYTAAFDGSSVKENQDSGLVIRSMLVDKSGSGNEPIWFNTERYIMRIEVEDALFA